MIFDINLIKNFYNSYSNKVKEAKAKIGRPMTLSEKNLYTHLAPEEELKEYKKAVEYVKFAPDRVAMQDATAQMALLQLMNSGQDRVATPTTTHCDHLIQAYQSAEQDLKNAKKC